MAAAGGLFTMARTLTRHRVRIFAYHGVSREIDSALNFDGFFVHPDAFEKHLRTFKGHYHVMPLTEIVRALAEGRPLPPNAAAITFDDGYANNFARAAPLLAKYELPATFFVTTGFIDGTHFPWWFALRAKVFSVQCSVFSLPDGTQRPLKTLQDRLEVAVQWERRLKELPANERNDFIRKLCPEHTTRDTRHAPFMTWDQIRALAAQGHEIGAHTVSHVSLGHESFETLEREVADSMARIDEELGYCSPVYSYPYGERGHFKEDLAEVLRRNGCVGGVTTLDGLNAPKAEPFFLKRLNVTGNHGRNEFRALACGLSTFFK